MLESIFLGIFTLAIMMNIIGWLAKKPVFVAIAMMTWVAMIYTNSLRIEVPGDTSYTEAGLQAFVMIFVFIDILFLVAHFLSWKPLKNWIKGDWGG